ncbi:hypothetical protein SAY87_030447 [Trapa incisa]|uniref:J domain-containing protein n=2 Tax=Trapa TaxID=22665 RepID=A0AAN7LID4_TRANT|nr:hypothetical protein SAY87_030447 [Trapa incisa]KAK4786776.1 hypothetical protein SAY86_010609 [Trapa natans]
MDYYKVLGLQRSATKDEIKEAFRRLALRYHPDRHSQATKSSRDDATLRFKQVSEAYEVLIDDRKRAEYNVRLYQNRYSCGGGATSAYGQGYGYHRQQHSHRGYERYENYTYSRATRDTSGLASKFEATLRFMTTRMFLLNVAFAGALLGATIIIDRSREVLWKMQNSGKSFEEAMESIEKVKTQRD